MSFAKQPAATRADAGVWGTSRWSRHDCAECGPNWLFEYGVCIRCHMAIKPDVRADVRGEGR